MAAHNKVRHGQVWIGENTFPIYFNHWLLRSSFRCSMRLNGTTALITNDDTLKIYQSRWRQPFVGETQSGRRKKIDVRSFNGTQLWGCDTAIAAMGLATKHFTTIQTRVSRLWIGQSMAKWNSQKINAKHQWFIDFQVSSFNVNPVNAFPQIAGSLSPSFQTEHPISR